MISLRRLLMLLVGLLVIVALALELGIFQRNREEYRNALSLHERNILADLCVQAARNFMFERGRSLIALRGEDAVRQDQIDFIGQRRKEADRYIGKIVSGADNKWGESVEALRTAWQNVAALRESIDRNIVLRRVERDPDLAVRWYETANELIQRLEALLADSSSTGADILDANDVRFSNLRLYALQFRNFLGLESTYIAAGLSIGQPLTHGSLAKIFQLRGRSAQLWSELERNIQALSDPELDSELERLRLALFSELRPLQNEILLAAENRQKAKVELAEYFSRSFPALDSATKVVEGINQAATRSATRRMESAKRWQLVSLTGMAVVLAVAALVIWLLQRRFVRPLNEIGSQVNALLATQATESVAPSDLNSGDEFEKIRCALSLLDGAVRARMQSEQALAEKEGLSASILAASPNSIIVTDVNGLIQLFSRGAETMLGYTAGEMVGKQTPLLFHDPEEIRRRAEELSNELGRTIEAGFEVFTSENLQDALPEEREWTYVRKDGKRLTVLLAVAFLRDAQGAITGYLRVATDITGRKVIEDELLRSSQDQSRHNALLKVLLRTIRVGVFMVEAPSGKLLVANDAARMLLGPKALEGTYKHSVCEGLPLFKLPERIPYPEEMLPMVRGLKGESTHVEDMLLVNPDGQEINLEVMGSPVLDGEGNVWACVISFSDITERIRNTAEMSRLAYYDHLTRLPNRRLFHDRMQMAITRARRENSMLGVLLIDLDRFKPVNDNLGHAVGDKLLQAVAERILNCLRESDTLARIGGDEFVAILPGIEVADDALHVAEKVRLALNEPFDLPGGYRLSIACCVGVAIYPDHGRDEKRLVKCADDAMYMAKEKGRNGVCVYDGVGMAQAGERDSLEIVRLVWHRVYRCGEASIDEEHKALFDKANMLINASLIGSEDESLGAVFDDMIGLVKHHFAHEEAVLLRCGYPGLHDHHLKHQRLIGEALELRELVYSGGVSTGDLVGFLANEVVLEHMLSEDRKFFPYLAKMKPQIESGFVVDFREQ